MGNAYRLFSRKRNPRCLFHCFRAWVGRWTNHETEAIVLAVCAVIGERSALSATCSAKTCNFGIKVQVCAIRLRKLIGMSRDCHLLRAPRQGRHRHRAVGDKHDSRLAAFAQRTPTHVFAIAHGLRLWQDNILLSNDALMVLYELSSLSVAVVVHWPSSVIVELAISFWQLHRITYTRQNHACLTGRDSAI